MSRRLMTSMKSAVAPHSPQAAQATLGVRKDKRKEQPLCETREKHDSGPGPVVHQASVFKKVKSMAHLLSTHRGPSVRALEAPDLLPYAPTPPPGVRSWL
jgi:hypothetical protein